MNESLLDKEFAKASTRKVVIEVYYNDVDDLISRHFPNMAGGQYECVEYEDWGNDQDHSMVIDGKLSEYKLKEIHKMISTGIWLHWNTHTILDYLCSLGIIEPAEYLISVSW